MTLPGARSTQATPRAAVGIFAHNEEATIRYVVEGFLGQRMRAASLCEVVVVCCGCTDDTVDMVKDVAASDARVRLLVRPRREGKVAAINEFLSVVDADVLVLSSGDVVPADDAIDRLVSPLAEDGQCMMTGPRVVMAKTWIPRRIVDHLHDVLWALHHAVSLHNPKLGEIVAIRSEVLQRHLPPGIHCDEALMESIVVDQGGSLGYVADALVYNFAPTNVRELYRQRRRVAAQHVALRRLRGYRPSTTQPRLIFLALRSLPLRRFPLVLVLAGFETAARIHGYLDARRGRSYQLWRIARPPSRMDHLDVGSGTYRNETCAHADDERCA
ncbi:glycosyltransferase family 2 protein [Micromonospora sp. WMMD1082]|uniref:glycosyltransferase n=1 Tax=Micromonospora sp. WMMD1082 TaxID=3016104 RepID=UPI00241667EE|nr:glycosyltransferase family 2 protein [Micromonospora sp. WMMD1082]MDG4793686.1 glycosyltransferase family 2 protein [Micromonospora sp. WMMD1082]